MSARLRWVALGEVALFYSLAMWVIWFADRWRPSVLPIAVVLVGICVASNVLHRDSLRRVGLSAREFWPCAARVTTVSIPLLIPLAWFAWKGRYGAPWNTAFELAGYPVWSFAQEYAMLGFVTNRLEDALGETSPLIPWINAMLFSFAHLPNPVLMTVTAISAVLFTRIFQAHRQLVPISLAHAVFGTGIGLALSAINGVMSVGPGYAARVGTPVAGW